MNKTARISHHFASFTIIATTLLVASLAEAKFCGFRHKVACSGMVTTESSSGNITYVVNRVVYNSCGKVVSDKLHKLTGTPEQVESELRRARCPQDSF
ncbi:hypothetical protein B9G69_001830 [Bdellovibrio sp. SKB1291214]|uniref:hypothetical protein n=1 Tax=Bdellovibrio sp. SKB1291214 TaxID=1732569 RepID=UPI000B51BB9B|nr:hypothetical protein [Bdellovibrio sp. SKB1291214]UYL09310.1 hypothetical protein B9G69_001830 [Bdellovibrio sp. SKB1291214]